MNARRPHALTNVAVARQLAGSRWSLVGLATNIGYLRRTAQSVEPALHNYVILESAGTATS